MEMAGADGAMFTAWVKIPTDGAYQFDLGSDGAGMVFVHDSRVLATEHEDASTTAVAHLAKGWHPVRVYAMGAKSIMLTVKDAQGRDVLAGAGALMH